MATTLKADHTPTKQPEPGREYDRRAWKWARVIEGRRVPCGDGRTANGQDNATPLGLSRDRTGIRDRAARLHGDQCVLGHAQSASTAQQAAETA